MTFRQLRTNHLWVGVGIQRSVTIFYYITARTPHFISKIEKTSCAKEKKRGEKKEHERIEKKEKERERERDIKIEEIEKDREREKERDIKIEKILGKRDIKKGK